MNTDFCLRMFDETVKQWHQNWRRSVGFQKSLCFAMFRWIRVWTIKPLGWAQLFRWARFRYNALRSTTYHPIKQDASSGERKCPRNTRIPPWGKYGKTRSSNIETAKQLDFSKSVSDKTILMSPAHGRSSNLRQKSYRHFEHKKYYELNPIIDVRILSYL